jgi:Flp pilus assembly pilin Flp
MWRAEGEPTMKFINRLRAVVREESGQDLLEYALLIALIALVAVAAVTAAGFEVQRIFTDIAAKLAATA